MLLVGLLLGGSQFFRIREVTVKGDSILAEEKLTALNGRSIFSSSVSHVSKELASLDLTISRIDCQRGLPSVLKCQVLSRQAVFNYQQAGKVFLVDEQGLLFAQTVAQPGLVTIIDGSTTDMKVASQALSRELVKTYQKIITRLAEQGYQVRELRLGETLYQLEAVTARPDRDSALLIKLNLVENIDQQLAVTVSTLKQRSSEINEYLDLRVAGVVYFK